MRLLLDTHIVLGIINGRTTDFPAATRELLSVPHGEYYASVASLWEIAVKSRLGKLQISCDLQALPDWLLSAGVELIAINEHHVLTAVHPEPPTRDPFDRLLLAQCDVEDLRLVTVDRALVSHPLAASIDGGKGVSFLPATAIAT